MAMTVSQASDLPDAKGDEIGFLHSALCTMSLPVRRPANEFAPILRQDGRYSMLLQPRAYPDGQGGLVQVGVPFGAKARLVLIHIMTEAVKSGSPEVYLGRSLSHWMRRLGYRSFSGGPAGTMTLFKEQVRRLARCDWTIRREMEAGEGAQLSDVRLSDDLMLWSGSQGEFVESLTLNQRFFDHLREHAVPLSEHALTQLRDNPTALDLYVWLVYRLPRLQRPAVLSWRQVSQHFGNDYSNLRQFRHEMRKLLPKVIDVYPAARVDMSDGLVKLSPSPPAMAKTRSGWSSALAAVPAPEPLPLEASARKDQQSAPPCALKETLTRALADHLEAQTIRAWFKDVQLADGEGGLSLECPSAFHASHIRSHFATQLALCFKALGWGAVEITNRACTAG